MLSPRTSLHEGDASGSRDAAEQLLLGKGAHIKEVGRTKQGFRKEGHICDTRTGGGGSRGLELEELSPDSNKSEEN